MNDFATIPDFLSMTLDKQIDSSSQSRMPIEKNISIGAKQWIIHKPLYGEFLNLKYFFFRFYRTAAELTEVKIQGFFREQGTSICLSSNFSINKFEPISVSCLLSHSQNMRMQFFKF